MTQAIQITRAGKMTETIRFRNPQGLEKFVEAFAETETPPTEDHILSFLKENPGAITVIYYRNKNDQFHDGQNGEAAVRDWDKNGTLRHVAHYQNGRRYNNKNGEAAVRDWDKNGTLRREMHCQNGRLQDSANGVAAVRDWDQNGKLTYAGRYSKGMLVQGYKTPEELAAYLAAYEAEMKTKKALAVKLPPGMKFV